MLRIAPPNPCAFFCAASSDLDSPLADAPALLMAALAWSWPLIVIVAETLPTAIAYPFRRFAARASALDRAPRKANNADTVPCDQPLGQCSSADTIANASTICTDDHHDDASKP